MKDLHLGERYTVLGYCLRRQLRKLMKQVMDSLHFLVALCIQIKKRFPLEEVVASYVILDRAAAQYLTK